MEASAPGTIALMTPSFAPDLRDAAVMMAADLILLDDAMAWSRKSRITRAKIRMGHATGWLHIAIHPDDRKKPLFEARTDPDTRWIDTFSRTLDTFYRGSFYYDEYGPWLLDHLEPCRGTAQGRPLLPLLMDLRTFLFTSLHLDDLLKRQELLSSLGEGDGGRLLPSNRVLMEDGARAYMRNHAGAVEIPFTHPVYRQHGGGFLSGCSLLDLLFNMGPESWKVIGQFEGG